MSIEHDHTTPKEPFRDAHRQEVQAKTSDGTATEKSEHLKQYDLAGLKLAHSSILGIAAQVCDITQEDDRPDEDVGAVIQHLGAAARHLAGHIALLSVGIKLTCLISGEQD